MSCDSPRAHQALGRSCYHQTEPKENYAEGEPSAAQPDGPGRPQGQPPPRLRRLSPWVPVRPDPCSCSPCSAALPLARMVSLRAAALAGLAVSVAATAAANIVALPADTTSASGSKRKARRSEPLSQSAEHAGTTLLTAGAFNSSTAEGTWFIEYFLPDCPHCQRLAPIWAKLENDFRPLKQSMNFHFGQVNCNMSPAICQNIGGVPTLQIHRQNAVIKEFDGSNTYEAIANFVEDESSSVANPFGTVVSMNNDTFDELTQKGKWFVEFFAPWCGHCQKFAPTWAMVGEKLKYKINVGKVDCTVEKAICRQQDIQGYPTIKLLQDGASASYRGDRQLEGLLVFAEQAIASKIEWISLEDFPRIKESKAVAFLFIIPENAAKDVKDTAVAVAREFALSHKFLMTSDPKLAAELKLPQDSATLTVLKDGEATQYENSMRNPVMMRAWVRREKFPLVVQLDSNTAADILDADRTLVLGLLPDDGSRAGSNVPRLIEELMNAARAYRDRRAAVKGKVDSEDTIEDEDDDKEGAVMFAWIDGSRWGEYISRVYRVQWSDMPAIIIARPQQDHYWDSGVDGRKISFQENAVLQVLMDAQSGKIEPKTTIGFAAKVAKRVNRVLSQTARTAIERPFFLLGVAVASLSLCVFTSLRGFGSAAAAVGLAGEKAD